MIFAPFGLFVTSISNTPNQSGSHLEVPKYKCPGCRIKTCSLACVKRHKARSQCSGVRNAAPYKKRHELATPTSMDQDFNFIARLERNIDRLAGRTEERGLNAQRPNKRAKHENRREHEIRERGPTILKAPAGLSRARQNLSKWDHQHQCLVWTIEWVFEDGHNMMASSKETLSINDAFVQMGGKKQLKKHGKAGAGQMKSTNPSEATTGTSKANLDAHFYLHRPNVPANVKCVIPMKAEASIRDSVQGRTLLDFPTFYVFNVEADKLPIPFVSEEKYIQDNQGDEMLSTASSNHEGKETLPEVISGGHEDAKIDAAQIADVLLTDLSQT